MTFTGNKNLRVNTVNFFAMTQNKLLYSSPSQYSLKDFNEFIVVTLPLVHETVLRNCSSRYHHVKYRNFTKFPVVEILWKSAVSALFRAIGLRLCRSCAFPQNFYNMKLGAIMVFYVLLFQFIDMRTIFSFKVSATDVNVII